jgi:hypothetical protein
MCAQARTRSPLRLLAVGRSCGWRSGVRRPLSSSVRPPLDRAGRRQGQGHQEYEEGCVLGRQVRARADVRQDDAEDERGCNADHQEANAAPGAATQDTKRGAMSGTHISSMALPPTIGKALVPQPASTIRALSARRVRLPKRLVCFVSCGLTTGALAYGLQEWPARCPGRPPCRRA